MLEMLYYKNSVRFIKKMCHKKNEPHIIPFTLIGFSFEILTLHIYFCSSSTQNEVIYLSGSGRTEFTSWNNFSKGQKILASSKIKHKL